MVAPTASEILLVGDSLTVGESASAVDRTFASRVITACTRPAPMPPPMSRVAAISGARVRHLLARAPSAGLDLVIVELGTNDWVGWQPRGPSPPTPIGRFADVYGRLLGRVVGPGARLVCLGVWGPTAGCTQQGARLADYDAAIAVQCRARGGAFVVLSHVYDDGRSRGPAGRPTPFGVSDDGHPNDVGHRLVADIVLATVSRLVAPVAGPG